MTNQPRLRPTTNTQKPVGRVPVTRPVGRPQEAPTQSFEREEAPSPKNFQEPVQQPRMAMPPNMGFEEELEEDNSRKSKNNLMKYIGFGIIGTVIIIGIIFLIMKMTDGGEPDILDGSAVTQGQETNPLANGAKTLNGETTTEVNFDGNPIPVKWPSDVTPTRMEIQLDPVSGDPVLMLVGDKSGLGTVIRSYSSAGQLSGYWVIVPDSDSDAAKAAPAQENAEAPAEEEKAEETPAE